MKAWLFTWNPKKWSWAEGLYSLDELSKDIEQIGFSVCKWTCGGTKSIQENDKIYIMRLGCEPKGIVACGTSLSNVFVGTSWKSSDKDIGKSTNRILVKFDRIYNPNIGVLVDCNNLQEISSNYHWFSQSSGVSIPVEISEQLDRVIERI